MPEFRPFGRPDDLDLELQRPAADIVVTDLLTRCSTGSRERSWWDETVGARIAALIRLVATTDGAESFTVTLRCDPPCDTPLEIDLPFSALQESTPADARVTVGLPGGARVTVRAPIGDDQRRWRARAYTTRDEAVAAMLDTLVVDGVLDAADAADVGAVAEALGEHDPLVAFSIAYTCPACGVGREQAIDLERLALDRLSAVRQALIQDVHVLASRYGWTEAEVLAVPPRRRALYRTLIDEAAS